MEIKKFNDFDEEPLNEKGRTELFGVDKKPSNVISRQEQDFYDFYTHSKFRGMSKYQLNSEVFKLAQKKDDVGILAQFCLQIERESIAADDYIYGEVSKYSDEVDISLQDIRDNSADIEKISKGVSDNDNDIDNINKDVNDGDELKN